MASKRDYAGCVWKSKIIKKGAAKMTQEIISKLQKLAFETTDVRHKFYILDLIKELEANNDK